LTELGIHRVEEEALTSYHEALQLFRNLRDPLNEDIALHKIGQIELHLARESAHDTLERAYDLLRLRDPEKAKQIGEMLATPAPDLSADS
jgi:uncharacterized protein YutE (UPF0331/DUF86 family)